MEELRNQSERELRNWRKSFIAGLLLPIENEETADLSREDDNSSNDSDIEFDSESKSSNEKFAELLDYLDDVDIEKYGDDLDEDDDSNNGSSDNSGYENKRS